MIKANNVSICYRMTRDKIQSIKEYLVALIKHKVQYEEFRALDGVSFEIKKGEVVGIVGNNGAGKSTLLKVISGILKPAEGSLEIHGNVVPMLELGSGFDFDLTGRENIFLNGAILGYSESFLKEKYDEIVAFSELGDFINSPVRNYSSGMVMRLAFSIASMVSPDILIVDEILAVGDAAFQEKSYARMMELMSHGTTVLLVSHSIDQIRGICDRVIWLDHGKIVAIGEADEICDQYAQANALS
ncbi:MAG: ABC transporter ATP-binding protein [Clostridia bacterium]|nr:ABC transporter ATP-binding protein [Clostridia bacterium]